MVRWLVGLSTLVIAALTLRPDASALRESAATPATCLVCGTFGMVDVLCNVILFLPFGAALRLLGRRTVSVVLIGAAASLGIECMQVLALPGRDATLSDFLTNTLGTWLGASAAQRARQLLGHDPSVVRRLALASIVGAASVFAITSWLLQPAFTTATWFAQRAPDLGHLERFPGRVIAVDDAAMAISATLSTREAEQIKRSPRLEAVVIAGAAPGSLAPILAVFDGDSDEQLMLGQTGTALHFRVRLRSADVRLGWPSVRLPTVFRDGGGDTVRVGAELQDGAYRIFSASAHGAERSVRVALGPGWGWRLVFPFSRLSPTPSQAALFGWLWLAVLNVPFGWYLAAVESRPALAGLSLAWVLAMIATMVVVPVAMHLPPATWFDAAALVVGCAAGAAASRALRSRIAALI